MSIPYPGPKSEPDPLTNGELRLIPGPAASEIYRLRSKVSNMVDLLNLIRDNLDPDNSLCDAIEDVIGERA